jgi:hypothetical protein
MSIPTPVPLRPRIAVKAVGTLTVLFGVVYVTAGGALIFGASNMATTPAGGWAPFMRIIAGLLTLVGGGILLVGILGVVAGFGVLFRKRWGRILAFIFAALATLFGLAHSLDDDPAAGTLAFGAAQILFGIFAFVVLIRNGAGSVRQ